MSDVNQYDVLSTPRDESKDSSILRSRKDDIKESAYQAREGVKNKAAALKEQVVESGLLASVQSQLNSGINLAKSKISAVTGVDLAGKSTEQAAEELQEAGQEEWETVKRKGKQQAKKLSADAQQAVDENLTPQQKQKLAKGVKQAKLAGQRGINKANGLFDMMLSAPQLRPLKNFIVRNSLQTPAMILMALGSLWLGLTLIRLITMATSPKIPEFDIHSADASKAWLKYHAGEYKGRAIEAKESLPGRVAAFFANYELGKMGVDTDKLKANAIDWKDIGMHKLGLAEPTYTEAAWSWLTGRPLTWQSRVQSVLKLGKAGLKATALKKGAEALKDSAFDSLGLHHEEPSMWERATSLWPSDARVEETPSLGSRIVDGVRNTIPGLKAEVVPEPTLSSRIIDGVRNVIPGLKAEVIPDPSLLDRAKATVTDGIDSIRSHLPGAAEAEAARARAYAATHQSTLGNIKSTAEYIKNRVVHGAEEAAHIAQDRANEIADKAKYKTGL